MYILVYIISTCLENISKKVASSFNYMTYTFVFFFIALVIYIDVKVLD